MTLLFGTMCSRGPEQSRRVLHHVYARWCRQRRVLLSKTDCAAQPRSRVAAAGVALSLRKRVFLKAEYVTLEDLCYVNMSSFLSEEKKISLCLPANGNAVSGVFVLCVNQKPGAGLFSSWRTRVATVAQGSIRLQSTRSCSKSRASPQPGE